MKKVAIIFTVAVFLSILTSCGSGNEELSSVPFTLPERTTIAATGTEYDSIDSAICAEIEKNAGIAPNETKFFSSYLIAYSTSTGNIYYSYFVFSGGFFNAEATETSGHSGKAGKLVLIKDGDTYRVSSFSSYELKDVEENTEIHETARLLLNNQGYVMQVVNEKNQKAEAYFNINT